MVRFNRSLTVGHLEMYSNNFYWLGHRAQSGHTGKLLRRMDGPVRSAAARGQVRRRPNRPVRRQGLHPVPLRVPSAASRFIVWRRTRQQDQWRRRRWRGRGPADQLHQCQAAGLSPFHHGRRHAVSYVVFNSETVRPFWYSTSCPWPKAVGISENTLLEPFCSFTA